MNPQEKGNTVNNSLDTLPQQGLRPRGFALISVFTALMLSLFLEALDQTIVGTAMPRIIAELHGLDRYTWVVTAYVLASMIIIPIVGKLSDQFGRKAFLIGGTSLFLLGSLLAGASQSMDQLIMFRTLQGLGAGMGMSLVFTAVSDLFEPAERAKWFSMIGIVYGVSSLVGPSVGGWLAEHGPLIPNLIAEPSRWRWVFYINLPGGLIAVLALVFYFPAGLSVRTTQWSGWSSLRRLDFLGSLFSAVATISLMLGLTWGSSQTYAWNSAQVLGLIGMSVACFVLFVLVEGRAEEPILPLSLFRNMTFSMVTLLSMLQMMVVIGLSLYLPLFLQGVLAVSPTTAGLAMTPFTVSTVFGAMVAGPLISALGRSRIIAMIGAALMLAGCVLISLMAPQTNLVVAMGFTALAGLGAGAFYILPTVAQNALPASQLGVGTAATRYMSQLGATLGIAIVGTVVNSSMSGGLGQRLPTSQVEKLQFAAALQHGFIAVLVFTAIALLATFFLKDVPLGTTGKQETTEEANDALDQEPVLAEF
jgi:EmrB/QacA subfamily drug resistance transporter